MSAAEHIEVVTEAGVCRVTFDRVRKKNAFTHGMYGALARALRRADEDPSVGSVLVRGAGGIFTAGNDLRDFAQAPPQGAETPVFEFLEALTELAKPLVAAVRGPAVGIGTTMLLHCDLVVVARDAQLSMPFTRLGLCPEAASSILLPSMLGRARAAELLLLGEPFSGQRALELGLASAALEDGEVEGYALRQAQALAALPPESVRITKALMVEPRRDEVRAAMKREATHFLERLGSEEAREAFARFLGR